MSPGHQGVARREMQADSPLSASTELPSAPRCVHLFAKLYKKITAALYWGLPGRAEWADPFASGFGGLREVT